MSNTQGPKIIAHRGGAGLRPENSLAAVEHAIELGVDGIEVDVHLSKDGEVVVYHDFRLNRYLTREGGDWLPETGAAVKDLTLQQLRSYDIGRIKPDTPAAAKHPNQVPSDGEPIPTLREIAARMHQSDAKDMTLLVEMKTLPSLPDLSSDPIAMTDASLKVCEEEGILDRTRMISFDWRGLRHVQARNPDIETVYLTGRREFTEESDDELTAGFNPSRFANSIVNAIEAAGGKYWGPSFRQLTTDDVLQAHSKGLELSVWTVNTAEDLRRMAYMNIDYVTTDRPDLALGVFS